MTTGQKAGAKLSKGFIIDVHLVDPLHAQYASSLQTTYSRGHRRLDYILLDASLAHTITRIGTVGMHKAFKFADHLLIYIDCNEKLLF